MRAYADGGELRSVRALSGLDVGSFVSAPAACVRAGSCVLFWNNFRTAIAFVSPGPTFDNPEQTVLAQHFGRDTPTDVDLACDSSGVCLFTWMVLREFDGFVFAAVKVLARALDVESGTFGPKLQLVDLPPDLNGGAHVETLGERRFAVVLRRDDGIRVQLVRVE